MRVIRGEEADYFGSACEHGLNQKVRQAIIDDRLVWSRSVLCDQCGTVEEDGDGFPPAFVKTSLIFANGSWSVVLQEPASDAVLKIVLRKILGTDLDQVRGIRLESSSIFAGTRTEAEWLVGKLNEAGKPARVKESRLHSYRRPPSTIP